MSGSDVELKLPNLKVHLLNCFMVSLLTVFRRADNGQN